MNRFEHPAAGRASTRHAWVVLAALASALIALSFGVPPVQAGWTSETVVSSVFNTRPALTIDGAGHLGTAWQESSSDPGIWFASDATGSWVAERVSSGDDWAPDLVFDAAGKAHVVFARFGTGSGLVYATNKTGSWVSTVVKTDKVSWAPSLAIDGAGALHVAYASEGFVPGIWYLTNATGTWVPTRVTTGTWDSEPSLALDATGKAHIAFARYDPAAPGIHVATNASGTWVAATQLTANAELDDYPALTIDGTGHRHLAVLRWLEEGSALLYLTDESGSWATTSVGLPAGATDVGIPAIGLDEAGEPEIVVRLRAETVDDTLWRFSDLPGATAERLMTGAERDENFPDILRDGAGRLTVAYRGAWHAPGIVLHREDPDEDATIAASVLVRFPSLDTDGTGTRHIAFERYATDASDGIGYTTDATGSWVDEIVTTTHGDPDLYAHGDPMIATPISWLMMAGGGWQAHSYLVVGREASVDAGYVAYSTDAGLRVIPNDQEATADGRDEMPTIAAVGAMPGVFLAFVRAEVLHGMFGSEGPGGTTFGQPEVVDSRSSWNPEAIKSPYDGDISIAYDRHDIDPGIYYAFRTYQWFSSRISRSWADSSPSVTEGMAVGPDEPPLYVAWYRACWGPSPGIYLATNRTGAWVTTQLVYSCDVYDPSIALLPDGRIVVSYTDGTTGLEVMTEAVAGGAGSLLPAGVFRTSRAFDPVGTAGTTSALPSGAAGAGFSPASVEPAQQAAARPMTSGPQGDVPFGPDR